MIVVRAAVPEDAAALATLERLISRRAYRGMIPDAWLDALDDGALGEHWRAILNAGHSDIRTHVALHEGTPAGFARSGPDRKGLGDGSGEFQRIYVHPDRAGAGIGRALMAAMAVHLAEAGHDVARVWVMEANHPARAFYERLGGIHEPARRYDEPIGAAHAPLPHRAYRWHDPARWASLWATY